MEGKSVIDILNNPVIIQIIVLVLGIVVTKIDKSDKIVDLFGKILDGLRSKKKK